MGRPKVIDDDEVLAVARRVFRDSGHAASTRDIAAAAGISQAVLYQRFGSKDELFFRAMMPEAPDLDALLGALPARDGFADLLGMAERIHAYMRAFLPTMLKVLAVPGVEAERLREWHDRLPFLALADALAARFKKLQTAGILGGGDPHACAVAFLAEIHALALFELLTRAREREQRHIDLRAVVTVLWKGFRPK